MINDELKVAIIEEWLTLNTGLSLANYIAFRVKLVEVPAKEDWRIVDL